MKNGAEHTEWKPALGAKEIRYLGQCGNASEDHREARKVTETLRYGQQKGIRYFFSLCRLLKTRPKGQKMLWIY